MIYSFLYVIAFSFALILIQKLDVSISPLFSLMITASIATLYFNTINYRHLKKIYSECWQNKTQWLIVMIIVLLMWGFTMAGPGKIGASLFNFIYFSWLGALGYLSLGFKETKKNLSKITFGFIILIFIAINIYFEFNHGISRQSMLGVLFALAGGTASFLYFKQSQYLVKNTQLTATQVLAVRFYFSIITLYCILPKNSFAIYFSLTNLYYLTVLAFLSLIIPIYFSQKALEKISSEQHAIINSLCPALTGVLQEIFFKNLKYQQLAIYLLYSAAIAGYYMYGRHRAKY